MKKLWMLIALVAMFVGLTACEEEDGGMIYDFAPIEIHFTLTGENGEDLLDPATPGTYADLPVKATFRGKTYEKDVFDKLLPPQSRAYLAILYGIYTTRLMKDGRYALAFGELDGSDTYENETIILEWGDGSVDEIKFSSRIKWKNGKPKGIRTFKLNGEEVAKDTPCPVIDVRRKALK